MKLWLDCVYSWRRLRNQPGFTLIAVITLSLGIGANVALFGVINGFLFKSIPIPNMEHLVAVVARESSTGRIFGSIDDECVRELRRAGVFSDIVSHDPLHVVISFDGSADKVDGELVSGNYFGVLGVAPRVGRLLQPADDLETASNIPMVISERLWQQWFASDLSSIGRTIHVSGYSTVIVGVAPASFKGSWLPAMLQADVWLPSSVARYIQRLAPDSRPAHRTLATLRAETSLPQANTAVAGVCGRSTSRSSVSQHLVVLPGRAGIVPAEFDHYGQLIAAVALVLSGLAFLIACANLANMLLAKGVSRIPELATRLALGATPRSIVRLVLTETALLAIFAGFAGIAFAFATGFVVKTLPLPELEGTTIGFDSRPDYRVIVYGCILAAAAMFAIGSLPAKWAASTQPWRVIATGGGGSLASPSRKLRAWLVSTQIAVSVILLALAGLCLQGSLASLQIDPGYHTSNLIVASVDLSLNNIDQVRGANLADRVAAALRPVAGVIGAAATSRVPGGTINPIPVDVSAEDGRNPQGQPVHATFASISPRLFQTLGVAFVAGRDFSGSDGPNSSRVLIINQRLSTALWQTDPPIGKRVTIEDVPGTLEVVGVVGDIAAGVTGRVGPSFYLPAAQAYSPTMTVVIRTSDNPGAMIRPIKAVLRSAEPDVAFFDVRPLTDTVGLVYLPMRFAAFVLGSLAFLGLVIAVLGVYGAVASFVSQRTREFGIRRALGSTDGQIYGLVMRQGFNMIMAGALPGVVVALGCSQFLRHSLFGVPSPDLLTFAVMPTTLVAAGLAACYAAARRTTRVEPVVALRHT